MENQLDKYLRAHIEKMCDETSSLQPDDYYIDALIATQKVVQCAEELKKKLQSNSNKIDIAKLLLLSAKMEMINSYLMDIKREYNL